MITRLFSLIATILLYSPTTSFAPYRPGCPKRSLRRIISTHSNSLRRLEAKTRDDEDTRTPNRVVWVIEDDSMLLKATVQYLRENTDYEIEPFLAAEPCMKLLNKYGTRNAHRGSASGDDGQNSGTFNEGVLPSCIISDIQIEDQMSGLEFLEYVRDHPIENVKGLPFVLLTARGMTDDRIAGYQKGGELRKEEEHSDDGGERHEKRAMRKEANLPPLSPHLPPPLQQMHTYPSLSLPRSLRQY